eukprot:5084010-Prorocentrum_lima.AAC.1
MALPMTHLYEEEGSKHHVIARYPMDQWIAAGEPIITVKHWVKLCRKISSGVMKNLGNVMSICTDMDAKL